MARAEELIAECKRTRANWLDLGNCGLAAIPAEVGQLVWLERLNAVEDWQEWVEIDWFPQSSGNEGPANQIYDISALRPLVHLHTLVLNGSPISDLGPLSGLSALRELYLANTQANDLSPLSGLALELLDIDSTQVEDLAPLAGARELKVLHLGGTQILDLTPLASHGGMRSLFAPQAAVADLRPLAAMKWLKQLFLRKTPVTDLGPLAKLSALEQLDVSETRVADLLPLTNLPRLRWLDAHETKVTDLSPLIPILAKKQEVLWSGGIGGIDGLYVKDCPLKTPPPEIVKQGNEAVLNYFRERAAGEVDHLYEAKMLILGEGGAGKTSLLRRLYQSNQPLPTESETTQGISIYRHEFKLKNGRTFRLNVWDFGGQEIYHATHQFFLTRRSLYLLVDDTRKDAKSVSDEGFRYWLEMMDVLGGHSPVLIFQNEKGGRSKAIDIAGIKGQYDNVKELFAGNLEFEGAADRVRDGIEFFASNLGHIGEELPARWIQVRADLEVRAAQTPYIRQEEYFEIYGRHLEPDRVKALHLSRYLHDLGVFLHFQDEALLARTVILQNDWATTAVFRILDDEAVKANHGRFDGADCERLWHDSPYADMHPELLALMQRFELCYELRDSDPPLWLAPQLLPPAKPLALVNWGQPDDLVLRYRYVFLPKGMISRLTVRLHRFVNDAKLAWVTGVLFERGNSSLLVELLATGNEIELRARGAERKELLSVVAADLDALNDSFHGLQDKVDKLIPCICRVCSVATVPYFFSQRNLLRRKEANRLRVPCEVSFDDVNVLELLDGIRLEQMPGWAKDETAPVLRRLKIFLASSSELKDDRDAFDLYFRQQNDALVKKGLYLQIVRWENFLDAMSETRLQDEYNRAIRACEVCVCLFFTKAGRFTEEEFDVAYGQFQANGTPRIYTYFKTAQTVISRDRKDDLNSLWALQDKLKALGHYYTGYDDIEHLKRQFRDQLDKLAELD